jgi:stage V sporulation protein AD
MRKDWITTSCGIHSAASVVGRMEKGGPLGACFDVCCADDRFAQKTWEKAESQMQRLALSEALGKVGLREEEIGAIFAGDLLNQCVGAAPGPEPADTGNCRR